MASVFCIYAVDIPVKKVTRLFPHAHNHTELIYLSAGKGFTKTDQSFQAYQEGEIIIYQPGSIHADIASEPGLQFCIGLKGLIAEKLPSGVWTCSAECKNIISKIHDIMSEPESKWKALDMDIYAGLLAVQLRRDLQSAVQTTVKSEKKDICETAKFEIERHLETAYTLDQLCETIFISKSYLRKLFREKYGESPLAYLIRKKLEIAEERLRITDLPVHEIAAKIGISNPFYFTTLFTKKIGISPTSYREKYRKDPNAFRKTEIPHS